MAWEHTKCCRSRMVIPEDLWPDILKRLTVKKLLEVRCVCRSWNSLISSPAFIKSTTTTTTAYHRLQVSVERVPAVCGIHHQADYNAANNNNNTFKLLDLPRFRGHTFDLWFQGPVHGVVGLSYYRRKNVSAVVLWNPVIRKHVFIHWPMPPPPHCLVHTLEGFGFDARTNDFKVVRSFMKGYYDIFSVRDGVWRMNCKDTLLGSSTSPLRCVNSAGHFLNGTVYWITTPATNDHEYDMENGGPYGLLLFDCEREEFTAMNLPPYRDNAVRMTSPLVFILDLGGRSVLALVDFVDDGICEIWTMQLQSSWSKLDTSAALALAAGDDIIAGDYFILTLLPAASHSDPARFKYTRDDDYSFYTLEETMMLMDIGKPDR